MGCIATIASVGLIVLIFGTGSSESKISSTVYAQVDPPGPVPTQPNDWKDDPLVDAPYATPFADVNCTPSNDPNNQPDYFCLSSTYMASRGWISGYTGGTFRPWNSTTRAQVCKIVYLAEGWQPNTNGGPHFSDVPPTDPFYTFIETAYNRGIITGYSDGTFRPGNNVTRGQFCKIMVLA